MKQTLMSGNEKREIELLIALHTSTDQGNVLEKRLRDAGVDLEEKPFFCKYCSLNDEFLEK